MREYTKTRLERLAEGEDFATIYNEEIREILGNSNDNILFDTELQFFHHNNHYDLIQKAKQEKLLLTLPRKSIEVEFKVDKIYSYNELFRDKTCREHSKNYYNYKEEIRRLFKENDKSGLLSEIIKSKYLLIQVEFEVNNRLRDLDNVMKPFLDNLFENTTNTDNSVKRISEAFIYKNEDNDQESIYVRLVVLNEDDVQLCSIKNSIKNRKVLDIF